MMTPEQKQFYEKLGDALKEVREDLEDNPEYMTDFDYDLMRVTKAAQKLHDLWPTLCEPEWRPIETAPKDGTDILAIVDGVRTIITWGKCSHIPLYGWIDLSFADQNDLSFCEPTHWMPLPKPPKGQEYE